MSTPIVTRGDDALTFTTSPTDVMRFLAGGDENSPDVYVIRVLVGEDTYEAGAGDLIFTPPNVPHTFMAIGDGPAKLVGINWPGGFHHLYAKMAPLFQVAGPPDFGALAAAAAEHGAEILGPPLAHLESAGGVQPPIPPADR